MEVTFLDGFVKAYDMSTLFVKYPQLRALTDRKLFRSGRLDPYGITWNDDLDIEAETIYQDGRTVRQEPITPRIALGCRLAEARNNKHMTQNDLAQATGINQADISKIERGKANPSITTLERIASALQLELDISFH